MGVDDLARVLRPVSDGGILDVRGQVEVISSVERDTRPVFRDLRWGVYVTFAADSEYVARCFKEYGLITDPSGQYSSMYKPFHLIGLELGITVASIGVREESTGAPICWNGDVVATANVISPRVKCWMAKAALLSTANSYLPVNRLL